VLFFATNSL